MQDRANKWPVSAKGGRSPRWRRDGKELSAGAAARLFEKPVQSLEYDVSPDGKRFVVRDRPAGEPLLSIHVVQNWFEEFRTNGTPPLLR